MNRILSLRKQKGLSQRELAELLHVHQTAVSSWETGRHNPDMQQAIDLADFFGVTTDYILGRNTPSNIETFTRTPVKVETFVREPMKTETFTRKDVLESEQKKEAPTISLEKMEELYIQMLAEEEGTTIDKLNLSEERRNLLHKLILSLLAE